MNSAADSRNFTFPWRRLSSAPVVYSPDASSPSTSHLSHYPSSSSTVCVTCPKICAVCSASNNLFSCPHCQSVSYCSVKHMELHKFQHKFLCQKLKFQRNAFVKLQTEIKSDVEDISEGNKLVGSPLPSRSYSRELFSDNSKPSQTNKHNESLALLRFERMPVDAVPLQRSLSVSHAAFKSQKIISNQLQQQNQNQQTSLKTDIDNQEFIKATGRAAWQVLHAVAENYPQAPNLLQQQEMKVFLDSFAAVYPCEKCRAHFQTNLLQTPPSLHSRAALVQWMNFFHNQINLVLGKPVIAK